MTQGKQMLDKLPEGWREMVSHVGPVVAGTAVSVFFLNGEWKRRLAQAAAAVPFSMYMAPTVYRVLHSIWPTYVTESDAGVLTACFGLALVAFVFEVLKQLQFGPILNEWFRKVLGLKPNAKN